MSDETLPRPATLPSNADVDETLPIEQPLGDEPTLKVLAPGQRVANRYVLESVVGHGGMGVVWRARDEMLGESVALKFLPEVLARDGVAVEELKEETKRARRLTHPNVVRTYDFVQDGTMAAIAMEYIEGDALANLRLQQPGKVFAVATLAPLVAQLCGALDYAHGNAKVVHRDIKPANLLVTRDGQLKVTDFGIARGLSEASVRLTGKAGRTSGTLVYASPQQLMGEKPTEADDIYALGATLYDLLTSKPPFFRGDAHILLQQVRERAPMGLAERRKELKVVGEKIPAEWEQTILACLAKRAEERPHSVREVAERLGLALDDPDGLMAEISAPKPGANAKGGSGRPRGKPLRLAAAAATVAIAALGYFWWPTKTAPREKTPAARVAGQGEATAPATDREFAITIDPPGADARVSIGPNVDAPVKNVKVIFTNLPDGEHVLTVKAEGFRDYETRVVVKGGRGAEEVKLTAARGTLELKARPGTLVTAVDARGTETRGTVDASGQVLLENLLATSRYTLRLEQADCEPVERTEVKIGTEGPTRLVVEQTTLPGELRVFSMPMEAEVRINGQAVGKTPATLKNQPSEKSLRVEVQAPGYRKFERTITLRPKEVRTVNVGTLEGTVSAIQFRNLPVGFSLQNARVLIDGREASPTRDGEVWRLDGLQSGEHVVEVSSVDHEPWKRTVTLEDRRTAQVDARLMPKPARLSLVVRGASNFSLWANGREVPLHEGVATLPSGEPLELVVSAKGYRSATRTVTMPVNGRESWDTALVPVSGGLEFRFAHAGFRFEQAKLLIDGKSVGFGKAVPNAPVRIEGLEVGDRIVEIVHPDYEPWRRTVAVRDGANAAVEVAPTAKPAVLTLAVTPSVEYTLWANGRSLPVTDGKATIPAGEELVMEVRTNVYKPARRTLTATPRATVLWEVALEKTLPPQKGKPWENGIGMKFVPVPGAQVLFCIWPTRVQDWQLFANTTKRSWSKPGYADAMHPATGVNWHDAKEFCAWLTEKERQEGLIGPRQGYRLPSDAEWGFAVGVPVGQVRSRSSSSYIFPWGKQWPPPQGAGNFADETAKRAGILTTKSYIEGYDDGFAQTSPVGYFPPNQYGLFDVAGNVTQWIEDALRNSTDTRGLRGSSYRHYLPSMITLSFRNNNRATIRGSMTGFRVVLEFSSPESAAQNAAGPSARIAAGSAGSMLSPTVAPAQDADTKQSATAAKAGATATAEPSWENSLGMKFVPVPGTEVLFSIWVTRAQDYEQFARATQLKWKQPAVLQGATQPAALVSWDDAKVFCAWLTKKEKAEDRLRPDQGYRLPTDAEWSVAVGLNESRLDTPQNKDGQIKDVYPWGAKWPPPKGAGNLAKNLNVDDFDFTSPVGSFAANRHGLYDMGGNVWQWCEDFYDGNSGSRVLRGGSFSSNEAEFLLSSRRAYRVPDSRMASIGVGFRCVLAKETTAPTAEATPALPTKAPPTPKAAPAQSNRKQPHPLPVANRSWENSLGMKFVPVPGTAVLFSIWDTRMQDYQKFADATGMMWARPYGRSMQTHPAVNMGLGEARCFCVWLTEKEQREGRLGPNQSYRLPQDWEWSVAVGLNEERSDTFKTNKTHINGVYPWGTQWPPPRGAGNYGPSLKVDSFSSTSPVGSLAANRFGLYDMGGNVSQWCESSKNGRLQGKVARGGSFRDDDPNRLLSSYRHDVSRILYSPSIGFRVVLAVDGDNLSTSAVAAPAPADTPNGK